MARVPFSEQKQLRAGSIRIGGEKMIEPTTHIRQFFEYNHLPEPLKEISKPFQKLALLCIEELPNNPERLTALRKLLEAKDAAVRAKIASDEFV